MRIFRTTRDCAFNFGYCCLVAAENEEQAKELMTGDDVTVYYNVIDIEDVTDVYCIKPDVPCVIGEYLI